MEPHFMFILLQGGCGQDPLSVPPPLAAPHLYLVPFCKQGAMGEIGESHRLLGFARGAEVGFPQVHVPAWKVQRCAKDRAPWGRLCRTPIHKAPLQCYRLMCGTLTPSPSGCQDG